MEKGKSTQEGGKECNYLWRKFVWYDGKLKRQRSREERDRERNYPSPSLEITSNNSEGSSEEDVTGFFFDMFV